MNPSRNDRQIPKPVPTIQSEAIAAASRVSHFVCFGEESIESSGHPAVSGTSTVADSIVISAAEISIGLPAVRADNDPDKDGFRLMGLRRRHSGGTVR